MKTIFSSLRREAVLEQASARTFDVIIIGGGITGAGIALDAATRGMSTLLVEMQDFAAGTSSRSTKLVHGGLRYLKQLEVKMVAEVGRERAIVYENGPHVTTPEWMLLPIYKGGAFGRWSTSIGLWVYDILAGVKGNERRKMLGREEALKREPLLKRDGLLGGGLYVEYRTDDARLTIEVIKEAVRHGATAINYARVDSFLYRNENGKNGQSGQSGRVAGVRVRDEISGRMVEVYGRSIINATGPWGDTLRKKDGSLAGKRLQLTKGIHIVIDQRDFPLKQAIYYDTPDGRMMFAIPRDGKTYVGTTDTIYTGDLLHPRMTVADRDYVIGSINSRFPRLNLTAKQIESSWAGLRPLIYQEGKGPSEISRKDEIWQSPSGLITIAGGKLTGYRKMAEMVVDRVADRLKQAGLTSFGACRTRHLPISGGAVGGSARFCSFVKQETERGMALGFAEAEAERLVRRYGSNIGRLFELAAVSAKEAKQYGLPLDLFVSLLYGIQEEMTVTPADFFIRRTGALLFQRAWVIQYKTSVIACMAHLLKWSPEQKRRYLAELEQHLHAAIVPYDCTFG